LIITVSAEKNIAIKINAAIGNYNGKYLKRVYLLDVHAKEPTKVFVNNKPIQILNAKADFEKASTGFYYDAAEKNGTVHVKTNFLQTSTAQNIVFMY
jgi:hypothetical protein